MAKSFDIKKLKDIEGYRLRIGQYRAIYTLEMVVMTVENIAQQARIQDDSQRFPSEVVDRLICINLR